MNVENMSSYLQNNFRIFAWCQQRNVFIHTLCQTNVPLSIISFVFWNYTFLWH